MDPDVLVLRSFDPLRRKPLTLGRESIVPVNAISSAIIISRPGAVFMRLWLETYRTYNPDVWGYHAAIVPAR